MKRLKKPTLSWITHYQPGGDALLERRKLMQELHKEKREAERLVPPVSDPLRPSDYIKFH